jgi:hypothetical protein
MLAKLRFLAASIILVAIILHSYDMYPYGIYVHIIGAILWSIISYIEKDYAILLNFGPQILILGTGIIHYLMIT